MPIIQLLRLETLGMPPIMPSLTNSNAGSSPTSVWAPTMMPDCTLWLRPDVGFVPNTSWADQIQGFVFPYTSLGGSTAVLTNNINGHKSVTTTVGANGFFSSSGISVLSNIVSASAWTFLTVFQYTGVVTPSIGSGYNNPSILVDHNGYWWQSVSTTNYGSGQYSGANHEDDTTIVSSGTYYVLTYFDGGHIYTSLNGGPFDAGTAVGNISVLTNYFNILTNYNGTSSMAGSVGDIVVWNQNVSQYAPQIFAWVHSRWGF
jgi:hypothetical protein